MNTFKLVNMGRHDKPVLYVMHNNKLIDIEHRFYIGFIQWDSEYFI
jgi:hypothetical protein